MRQLDSARVEQKETVEDLIWSFVFTELHLLTVNLSFLLCLLNNLFLKLHFGPLSSYLNHLIQVCHLNWEWLLLWRYPTGWSTALASKLLPIVSSLEHFIAARQIRWNLTWVQLALTHKREAGSTEITSAIGFGCGVKMYIGLIIQSGTCIFHASSSNRRPSITMWGVMRALTASHYHCCLYMTSRLIEWISTGSCLWYHSLSPLSARVRHMICAWPLLRSRVWLAMKTHPLSTGSHHLMTPVYHAIVVLAGATHIHWAMILAHLLLSLPPISIYHLELISYWLK